jgi:hypothetical protein
VRIGVPPEIVLVTLRAGAHDPGVLHSRPAV